MTTPDADVLERLRVEGTLKRLRAVEPPGGDEHATRWYRNPDGPDAATLIEALLAAITTARDAAAVERRRADAVTENAITILSGHGGHTELTFDQWKEAGGTACPVCLTAEVERLTRLLDSAGERNEATLTRYREAERRAERLTADLAAARAQRDNAESDAGKLQAEVNRLHDDLAAARAERDGLAHRERVLDSILTQLVALKDGPRDDTYYLERDAAWERARAALAALPTPPDQDGDER